MDRKKEIAPILEEIRTLIRHLGYSQRRVEKEAGFSKGYLSQLLAQNLDLKVWHLLAMLDVFGLGPAEFFERLYPPEASPALDRFIERSEPLSPDVDAALGQLYRMGSESLADLRCRLQRCERAVEQLEAGGYVHMVNLVDEAADEARRGDGPDADES